MKFKVVSAQENVGIKELFDDMANSLVDHYKANEKQTNITLLPKLRIIENR